MVAKNHCLMRLRNQNGKVTREVSEYVAAAPPEDKDEVMLNEQAYDLLEESIKELNEEQRQCVILFYLKKNSYTQISEKTGFSMMQVKSYIQNGKRNLKIILDRKMKQRKERKQ